MRFVFYVILIEFIYILIKFFIIVQVESEELENEKILFYYIDE